MLPYDFFCVLIRISCPLNIAVRNTILICNLFGSDDNVLHRVVIIINATWPLTFFHTFLVQIFSLWAVSDKKYGGLSFSSQDVGIVLAISGEHQEDGLSVLLKRFCYVLTGT